MVSGKSLASLCGEVLCAGVPWLPSQTATHGAPGESTGLFSGGSGGRVSSRPGEPGCIPGGGASGESVSWPPPGAMGHLMPRIMAPPPSSSYRIRGSILRPLPPTSASVRMVLSLSQKILVVLFRVPWIIWNNLPTSGSLTRSHPQSALCQVR